MDSDISAALDKAARHSELDQFDVERLLSVNDRDLPNVLQVASELRDLGLEAKGLEGIVTYSRKVFIPLTKLCQYKCSYCTFVVPHTEHGAEYLDLDEVLEIARRGREQLCTEALFTLGEMPEARHDSARRWLDDRGYSSTVDYLIQAAKHVVEETGLLPHVNAGAVSLGELQGLRRVAVSGGLMMEQTTARLLEPGNSHAGASGKHPQLRLQQLDFARQARYPFTTGMLIGIGETLAERAQTILDLKAADSGQIQEVIVQNFRAKPDTPMRLSPDATDNEMIRAIAATRLVFGPYANIQAPPNLAPKVYARWLDAGINDWGGISPVTVDHVNPEMPWPTIDELERVSQSKGFTLRKRLPVYPAFVAKHWIDASLWRHTLALADSMNLAREESWYAGEGITSVFHQAVRTPMRRSLQLQSASTAETAGCASANGSAVDEIATPQPTDAWLDAMRVGGTPVNSVSRAIDDALAQRRLDERQVEALFCAEGPSLSAIVQAADYLREQVCGDEVTYVVNRNITYTNFCHTGCGFCGFARPVGHKDGYYFEPTVVGQKAKEAWDRGATEVCVQGGIHPSNDGHVYLEIAREIKRAAPDIHLHGFSPLEITIGADTLGKTVADFLWMLKDAGLDTIPGTAAEVLDDEIRPLITPEKLTAADWLSVVESAHRLGIKSTATIMFGHLDNPGVWALHLLALRDLQTQTGGFTEIVPLPFVHHLSPLFLKGASRPGPTWREVVKMHAVARLVLNGEIDNVQASWVKLGVAGVQQLLRAGCNDFGGTLMEEHISRMAGAAHGGSLTSQDIRSAIVEAGRTPRQRNTVYGAPHVLSVA